MEPFKSFWEIVEAIGAWSQQNFNRNQSKHTGQVLWETCSVLGLGEECGEMMHAILTHNSEEIEDSAADVGVYLGDLLSRINFKEMKQAVNSEAISTIDCCMNASSFVEMDAIYKAFCDDPNVKELLGKCYISHFSVEECKSILEIGAYITFHVGNLQHAFLKRHQGIRDYKIEDKFNTKVTIHVLGVLIGLIKLNSRLNSGNYLETLNRVYFKVVEKRDWVANPSG